MKSHLEVKKSRARKFAQEAQKVQAKGKVKKKVSTQQKTAQSLRESFIEKDEPYKPGLTLSKMLMAYTGPASEIHHVIAEFQENCPHEIQDEAGRGAGLIMVQCRRCSKLIKRAA
jgi:hypothetical protein